MKNLLAFIWGAIFALGLILSGMSNPEKVLAFLDIFGHWDPSLAFVMLGALSIAFIPTQILLHQQHPTTILNAPITFPTAKIIDKKLIIGAMLFGLGWGIAGICPAPALTLIGLGHYHALYFIIAMLIGMLIYKKIAQDH